MQKRAEEFMQEVIRKNPGEAEFHQAVREVVEAVMDHYGANPKYVKARVLERMTEPERVIMFRVPWINDKGEVMILVRNGFIDMDFEISEWRRDIRLGYFFD